MTRRHKTARGDRSNTARWSRQKLLWLVAGAALMTVVLVAGLVISVIVSLSPTLISYCAPMLKVKFGA